MCIVIVANTIKEILDEKIQNGDVFTAYDITIAVRAASSENIHHGDVQKALFDRFNVNDLAGYDRELKTLDLINNPQAFVYFPDTKQASDHALVSVSAVSSHVSIPVVSTPAVTLDADEYKTTNEGRVQIPRKLLSQVTPNAGTYDLIINGSYRGATTDARGDLRIGLRQFGIKDDKVKLTVDTSNNTIKVETV